MMEGHNVPLSICPDHHSLPWFAVLLFSSLLFDIADGCIRRSLFHPESTTFEMTREHTVGTGEMNTVQSSHKQECLPEEVPAVNCLHGGTCFAVDVNDFRQTGCHCTSDWTGMRCEQVFIDPKLLPRREQMLRNANIAAGVSVCILVLLAAAFAAFVKCRYRRKKKYLSNREFEASAEELYRQPFNKRSSVVESLSRKGTLRRSAEQKDECIDGAVGDGAVNNPVTPSDLEIIPYIDDDAMTPTLLHSSTTRGYKPKESAL